MMPHGDYYYVGLEQGDEHSGEVAGLQMSWQIPPYDSDAQGSFRVVIGKRTKDVSFAKDVVTYQPCIIDGLISEKEEMVGTKTKWLLRPEDEEAPEFDLVGEKFGAPSLTLSFQCPERRISHLLARVDGVSEFCKRLAAYASEPVEFYTPPRPTEKEASEAPTTQEEAS